MTEVNHTQFDLAWMFQALGDPMRLKIFEFIQDCSAEVAVDADGSIRPVSRASEAGPVVGEVCCWVTGDVHPDSAISFHLKALRQAGLIYMERRGRHYICSIVPDATNLMLGFLRSDK